jgi:membrane fusion protein, multidrug efflux system
VRDGERFKEGQPLVTLDCLVQRAQLEEARATMAAAEKTYSVNRRLHEMNAGGALEIEVAAAEVAKNHAKINAGAAIVSKCNLAAPFSGRAVEVKVHDHQFVQAGQAMLEILDDSVLEVEFLAPSRWLSWLKPGHVFEIAIDETGRSYPAKVARLGAKVDPLSQSIKVVAEVTGTFSELLAGMSGRVGLTPPASP